MTWNSILLAQPLFLLFQQLSAASAAASHPSASAATAAETYQYPPTASSSASSFQPPAPVVPVASAAVPLVVSNVGPETSRPNCAHFRSSNSPSSTESQQQQQQQASATDNNNHKKSAIEEQYAMAGMPSSIPSVNRCVPIQIMYPHISLKKIKPTKFLGDDAVKTQRATLRDYYRLVNFPDYVVKPRKGSGGPSMVATLSTVSPFAGMRHCVMCGKLRPLKASSSSSNKANNASVPNSTRAKVYMEPTLDNDYADDNNGTNNSETSGTCHIIPTQNKGVCTACDVTVWVFVHGKVEIKWCKGCKNFKPWIAFGEKIFGTKCLQCRERQRGKYAEQKVVKDRIRWGVSKSSSSPANTTK